MPEHEIEELYGLTPESRAGLLPGSKLLNHRWDLPDTLKVIGRLTEDDVRDISGGLFAQGVDVAINRHVYESYNFV